MNKSTLTVKILIGAMTLFAASCSNKSGNEEQVVSKIKSDSISIAGVNIRYVDYDSLTAQYDLAKEINEMGVKLMNQYHAQERQKQQEIQTLGAEIERKQQNNIYLSQASYDADIKNFNKKNNEALQYLTAQQNRIENEMAMQAQRLNDSIKNFLEEYNITRGYDAILFRHSGLYFNPALNITSEIVEGLNQRYNSSEKK